MGKMRLDKFLREKFPNTPRSYWKKNLETIVRMDGKKVRKGQLLQGDENITFLEPPPEKTFLITPNPQLDLQLLYEDDFCFAVNKPAGLPCHPLQAKENETLANAVVARFPDQVKLEPHREAGLVHRLDNETSGVVLFAKTPEALRRLGELSQDGEITKKYLALVQGSPPETGSIEIPIGHHPQNIKKMRTAHDKAEIKKIGARPALTEYRVLKTGVGFSFVELKIKVGARHQIRVHLAEIGHPILGDKIYGTALPQSSLLPKRQLLHASEIQWTHPFLKTKVSVEAPLPADFQAFLEQF